MHNACANVPRMIGSLFTLQWVTVHALVTLGGVLLYVFSAHVLHQRRHPASAIAWILFILLLPYVAIPAFLAFGTRKLVRPKSGADHDQIRAGNDGGASNWAVETLVALRQPPPAAYRDLSIHQDGAQARRALMDVLDSAQKSIDVCTFILGNDELGNAVVQMLARKAQQGLRVRLLVDGLGSMMSRPPSLRPLRGAGARIAFFASPLLSRRKGRANLRNHRKMVVADAGLATARLWCGGRNLAQEYFEGRASEAAWKDLSIDLRGPVIHQANAIFERDWAFATGQPLPEALSERCEDVMSGEGAQFVASGPDQADDTVYSILVTAAYRARTRICMATPYFVPDAALLMALCLAARRGVWVDLVLPRRSNHLLSDWARNRALRSLAKAGGRISLTPGMTHAKLVVVDDVLALTGSANIDSRSMFLNYEMMLAFHKATDVQHLAAWFSTLQMGAIPYAAQDPGLATDIGEGLLLWAGFQL
jgi:cardiolipin synthase A/B